MSFPPHPACKTTLCSVSPAPAGSFPEAGGVGRSGGAAVGFPAANQQHLPRWLCELHGAPVTSPLPDAFREHPSCSPHFINLPACGFPVGSGKSSQHPSWFSSKLLAPSTHHSLLPPQGAGLSVSSRAQQTFPCRRLPRTGSHSFSNEVRFPGWECPSLPRCFFPLKYIFINFKEREREKHQ